MHRLWSSRATLWSGRDVPTLGTSHSSSLPTGYPAPATVGKGGGATGGEAKELGKKLTPVRHCIDHEPLERGDLAKQQRAGRKQGIRVGGGAAAVEGPPNEPGIEAARAVLVEARDRVVVRQYPAGHEARHEAGRIEQRPQIGFAVRCCERIAGRKGLGALAPIGERRAGQV